MKQNGFEELSPELRTPVLVGIKRAIEKNNEKIWKIGDVVGHESREVAHAIKQINDNEVTIWLPGKPETITTVPRSEIYDPNLARREAILEDKKTSSTEN